MCNKIWDVFLNILAKTEEEMKRAKCGKICNC
jgi:hypothetical protein